MNETGEDTAVVGIFPQPTVETKRVLILFKDGFISLWDIQESKVVYSTGGNTNKKELQATSNVPFVKLNLGYKTDKVPIVSLRWVIGDGKANRLYINSYSDTGAYSFQVGILCGELKQEQGMMEAMWE